jgi:hypothetical protein
MKNQRTSRHIFNVGCRSVLGNKCSSNISVVTLVRNNGYRSTLGIRNEGRVTIEAFTFLRKGMVSVGLLRLILWMYVLVLTYHEKGITKMEV